MRLRSWRAAVVLAASFPASLLAQTKAFPEAEGFGQFATGARTNLSSATVYHVTNLNDSGAGSLRDAVSQSNRFVVFDVGGIINLSSVLTMASNITIAGQTAPGGIATYGDRVAFHGANNLVSRYWAVRGPSNLGRIDAASIVRGTNMMFDHMSFTWGVDGTFDINPDSGQVIDNLTIQNSAVAQGLDVVGHSTGGLMTLGEGHRFSIIKSLFADNVTRNPKVRGENEFINNVVYGYETSGYIMGDTTAVSHANVEGNYFIEGPVDGSSPFASGTSSFHIYASDNWVDSNRNGILDGSLNSTYPGADIVTTPHAFPTTPSMSAQDAVPFVTNNFGPNITRDAVDARLAQEIASYGTFGGVIDRETTTYPGYGTDPAYLNPRARLVDTDNDGIPDNWETSKGLNPNNASDWKNLSGSYTQLEQYLNELGGYESTRTAAAGGTWTSAATWGGVTPTFADSTVAAGTLNVASGNGFARRLTLSGNLNVSGGTLDVFDTMAVNGTATLSGGTTSAGQVLLGSTGQTGALSLTGGTLQTGTIGSGGGTASLSLNGGAIKFTGTPSISVATTVGAGGATLNTNGFSGSITGGLSGNGTLTKIGAGTLTLGGNNSGYSGGINLNAGTLALATNAANSSTGAITAANGTTLNVTTSGASTPLALANGATITITAGGLTYNGAITGAVGTMLLVSNSSSGTSNFSIGGNLTNFAGTLDLAASTGNIRIGAGGSSLANFDAGDATGTIRTSNDGTTNFGSLTGGPSTRLQGSTNGTVASTYVIGANGNSTTFAGSITNGTNATPGIVNITKTGAGTLTFSGANVYTGTTTINAGVLRVNGSHVGGGNYAINAGGTLGGNGSISSAVTVNDGGAIAPGNSPGVLSVGSLTLATGADLVVELNGTSSYDQLNVTGSTSIAGADLLASLNYAPKLGDILYILKNDGSDAIGGTFAGLAQDGVINLLSSTDQRTYAFRISYTANAELTQPTDGNDISLTAVPEPGATGAVLLAMGGILSRRRRERRL